MVDIDDMDDPHRHVRAIDDEPKRVNQPAVDQGVLVLEGVGFVRQVLTRWPGAGTRTRFRLGAYNQRSSHTREQRSCLDATRKRNAGGRSAWASARIGTFREATLFRARS